MNDNLEILDSDLNSGELKLVEAEKGKRFANYLIDSIVYIILFGIFGALFLFSSDSALDYLDVIETQNTAERLADQLIDNLISMLVMAVYYIILESSLKGKTVGKYITGTRVVNIDGTSPSLETYVKRSFSRMVPFEALSFLGSQANGWHDRWTDTIVIDEKLSSF